jgi:hypothetical protein
MSSAACEKLGYIVETDLVSHFATCLGEGETPWGPVRFAFEFDYLGGHTDVVAICRTGEIVAFEAKLTKWRDALHQAYRARCFAHRSYVLLPTPAARAAVLHEWEFLRRRVGLCSLESGRDIQILIDTDVIEPLQPWLAARAASQLEQPGVPTRTCRPIRNSKRSSRLSALREG